MSRRSEAAQGPHPHASDSWLLNKRMRSPIMRHRPVNEGLVRQAHKTARLFLNDQDVGTVAVHGTESSWGFGEFHPNDKFSEFATIFGRWSLLMHADDDQKNPSEAALEELRKAECAIDLLRAKLFMIESKEWRQIRQVNIDGKLIEWKVIWSGPPSEET